MYFVIIRGESLMRSWLLALGAVGLAGCASTGGITHNKPTFQASTNKLDSIYATCVHTRWQAISATARIVETPTTLQVVVANSTTSVEELLVIHSKVHGADVVLYERLQVLAMRAYRESAKACL
jgi:hypothetical protein